MSLPPNLWGQQLGVCDHPKSCGATIGCSVPPPPPPQSMGLSLGGLRPPQIFWGHHWALCCPVPSPNYGVRLWVCGHPKSFGAVGCRVSPPPIYGTISWGSAATPNLVGPPLVAGFPLPQSMGPSLGDLQPPHIFWGHHWALCCHSPPNLWGCQLGVRGHPKSCGATIGCLVIHPPPNLWGRHLRSAVTTWAHPDLGSHQYQSPLQLLNTNIGSPPLLWFPPLPTPPKFGAL